MNSVYLTKSFEGEVTDVDMSARTVVQKYTKYNVLDSDGDIGRKGMFNKTWQENFERIKHLLNHDTTKPIGKPEKLWDDNDGAYIKSKIGTHSLGEDYIKMADSGLITEASYGYKTIKENKSKEGNELLEVKLWEVSSLTAWGANQYTPIISLTKSLTKEEQTDKITSRIKALEKFCKDSTATDETIQLLLLELKQFQQLFIDIKATTPVDDTVQPDKGEDSLWIETIKQFTNTLKTGEHGTKSINGGS